MNLRAHKDHEILSQIKVYVQNERDVLVKILHHLREIERRRLFSDCGCSSIFEYAVKELRYSEDQASRRIQAMRLIKDVPEVEQKIATGELSLTNAHQVQSLFRGMQQSTPNRIVTKEEKLDVIAKIENKSTREAQKELIKLQPAIAMPKERERIIAEDASEVRFILTDKLKVKLEEVRSLLGIRGAAMTYAELFDAMSDLSIESLNAKRFGKKRAAGAAMVEKAAIPGAQQVSQSYISKEVKFKVWNRDQGRCVNCAATRNLNYDHVIPVAIGGLSAANNIRLLCFACNQRASTKVFGRVYERISV